MIDSIERKRAAVIAVGNPIEALSIRTILESMFVQVELYFVGNPTDFLGILEKINLPALIFISGHGTEGGLYFGEYGPEVDTSLLENGNLHPNKMIGRMHLKNQTIISTMCLGGDIKYAEAFINAGAGAYIGSKEFIDFKSALFFTHYFLLLNATKNMGPAAIVDQLNSQCLIEEQFEFYDAQKIQREKSNQSAPEIKTDLPTST